MAAHTKKGARTARNMKQRLANLGSMKEVRLSRPSCALDAQAVELGVYDLAYHCKNRKERKSIVSTALTAQLNAA